MYQPASLRERSASAVVSSLLVAGIGAVLVAGLRPEWHQRLAKDLVAVDLAPEPSPSRPPPPPPPPPPRAPSASAPKDAPAPAGMRATQVVAPPPKIVIALPPPIVVAPVAGVGDTSQVGNSDRAGPGTGAGGVGDGTGGGGNGGSGNGDGGVGTRPRQVRGNLSARDLPGGLLREGEEAEVGVRYTVLASGRVTDCRIDKSSGFAALDVRVCQLIEQRFVYRPATDRSGQPVDSTIVETHAWVIER